MAARKKAQDQHQEVKKTKKTTKTKPAVKEQAAPAPVADLKPQAQPETAQASDGTQTPSRAGRRVWTRVQLPLGHGLVLTHIGVLVLDPPVPDRAKAGRIVALVSFRLNEALYSEGWKIYVPNDQSRPTMLWAPGRSYVNRQGKTLSRSYIDLPLPMRDQILACARQALKGNPPRPQAQPPVMPADSQPGHSVDVQALAQRILQMAAAGQLHS